MSCLTEGLKGSFVLKDAGNILGTQHTQAKSQLTETWPFGPLPDKNPGDSPPIGQSGIIEKMAKKQVPMGQRPAVEMFGR